MDADLVQLEGSVSAVVFQNRENGYSVIRLDAGTGDPVTVVGILPDTTPEDRRPDRGPIRGGEPERH